MFRKSIGPLLFAASIFLSIYFVTRKSQDPPEYHVDKETIEDISQATKEYRVALQKCVENKDQATAEILNRKSMVVNSIYSVIQSDLTVEQRLDLGVPIADLNNLAIDAVGNIEPQTGYTQHWLHSIKRRKVVLAFKEMGDHKGANQIMEMELVRLVKWKKQFEGMTKEEKDEFLSQPISEL